ncbi:unnamed protein product [Meloidogyne enterolobii]|uniref:Uncharacterized protein n=1 Tax=Meloidogyne enterolobii TaxID=390850 RepID=A0ACB0YMW5_MELEN
MSMDSNLNIEAKLQSSFRKWLNGLIITFHNTEDIRQSCIRFNKRTIAWLHLSGL